MMSWLKKDIDMFEWKGVNRFGITEEALSFIPYTEWFTDY